MLKLVFLSCVLFLLSCGGITEQISEIPFYWKIIEGILGQFPVINGWIVVLLPPILALLRAIVAILELIADKTETDWDNKVLKVLNIIVKWMSKIVGWITYGRNGAKT